MGDWPIEIRQKGAAFSMADGTKLLAQNKKARHDYFVEETYEAGISLAGTEVKSIRAGRTTGCRW